jgi:geranylgeranyl reductase family protein
MNYDVVVVGAGPAGSSTARKCAKLGLKTLLLEKEKLPRYKPCGGGITVKAEKALDFKLPAEIIHREVNKIRFHHKDRYINYESRDKIMSMVERSEFDKLMADKAVESGAELTEGVRARKIKVTDEKCTVKTEDREINTPIVVGADGVNSTIAGKVRPPFKEDEVYLALQAEIHADEEVIADRCSLAETYLDSECWGYGWVFPKREHLSVGLGGLLSRFKDSRGKFNQYLKMLGYDSSEVNVHAHLIPVGSDGRRTVSDRIILVGDAAGFVEPFTGEGIYYAVRSGQLAAEAVTCAYERNDFTCQTLERYETACREEFTDEFRRARKAARAFFMMMPLSARMLFSDRAFIEHFALIQTGRKTYKEFKKWVLPRAPYFLIKSLLPQ